MGNEIAVQGGLLPEGDAGVVRGHGVARHVQRRLLPQMGQRLRREQVGRNDPVVAPLPDELQKSPGVGNVGQIDRGFPLGAADGVAGLVQPAEAPGEPGGEAAVSPGDPPGDLFAGQKQRVHHPALDPPGEKRLLDGLAGGVVPLSGVAGEDQDLHTFPPFRGYLSSIVAQVPPFCNENRRNPSPENKCCQIRSQGVYWNYCGHDEVLK